MKKRYYIKNHAVSLSPWNTLTIIVALKVFEATPYVWGAAFSLIGLLWSIKIYLFMTQEKVDIMPLINTFEIPKKTFKDKLNDKMDEAQKRHIERLRNLNPRDNG